MLNEESLENETRISDIEIEVSLQILFSVIKDFTLNVRESSFMVIEYRGFIQVLFGFIEWPRWL